mgnify:FL=1
MHSQTVVIVHRLSTEPTIVHKHGGEVHALNVVDQVVPKAGPRLLAAQTAAVTAGDARPLLRVLDEVLPALRLYTAAKT